jgi:hypothetical protein
MGCGMDHKDMIVGREYNFSVGKESSKLSPSDFLEFVEAAIMKAIKEKHGEMFEIE